MGQSQIDMLHGSIWNKIPRFALPIAATAILEQLFNASDIAIVGNFAAADRTAAVAAVGSNSPIISLIIDLFLGIALGSNVVIAHAIGNGNHDSVHKAVHTSIVAAVVGGILVAIIGEIAAAPLLASLNVPDDVMPMALLYLRIYLLGLPVILLYNFEAAIFRSIGETKVPLLALAFSGVLNVILNIFFVVVVGMTVDGRRDHRVGKAGDGNQCSRSRDLGNAVKYPHAAEHNRNKNKGYGGQSSGILFRHMRDLLIYIAQHLTEYTDQAPGPEGVEAVFEQRRVGRMCIGKALVGFAIHIGYPFTRI